MTASVDQIYRAFDRAATKQSDLAENTPIIMDTFQDVAEQFEKARDTRKVQRLLETAKSIIELQRRASDSAEVLKRLRASYVPGDDETDFSTLVAEGVEERQASLRFDPVRDPMYVELKGVIDDVHGAGTQPGSQGDDDDDDVVMDSTQGSTLAPNIKCPLSGKQLLDIEDPVQDAMGFVYERATITQYLRASRGPGSSQSAARDCPQHGTSHKVKEKDLKPARRVIKAKRRHKANPSRGQARNASQLDIVVDL